ncbi:nuclear transport factor 2 family protein [Nocardia goodfellowii]
MSSTTRRSGISRAQILRGFGSVAAAGAAGALLTGAQANGEPEAATAHSNVELIQDYYAAYASGDLTKLRGFFADAIRWTIPGHHPLAGVKVGVEEVLAFFAELNKAGFRAEPISLAADKDWVIDLHRGWSTTPTGLDILWALAFRIQDGKIIEAVNFAADQHAADAYFWRVYPLAPLPARLG